MEQTVLSELNDGVFTITLNNPGKLNCIGMEMLRLLNEKCCEAEEKDEIKVVLLKGAGDRSFSTGGNLKEFNALSRDETVEWIQFGNNVFNRLEVLPKPTIAVIQGYAYGGGLELALACDLRVATEKASFSSPELQHGWIPGWGGLTRLRRLLGEAKAKEIVFLSEVINADEALRIGLVHRVIQSDALDEAVEKWIDSLMQLNNVVFAIAKSAIHDPNRKSSGDDLMYDVLATLYSKS